MKDVLDSPDWKVVGDLIDQNQRSFLEGRSSLKEDFEAWFKAVELLRHTEEERLIMRAPAPEDLRQHRAWVAGLIAEGERLLIKLPERGEPLQPAAGFRAADVEATLELLYLSQREWHGPKLSQARRREILKAVFNVEESAA